MSTRPTGCAPAKPSPSSATPAPASATQTRSLRLCDAMTATAIGPQNSIVTATPRGNREIAS